MDRPIIFSAPMVKALLAGRKTQTRRKVRFPKWAHTVEVQTDENGRHPDVICDDTGCFARLPLPYAVGDRLWVRETWQTGMGGDGPQITFKATPDYFDIDAWDGPDEGVGNSFNYDRCPGATWHTCLADLLSGAEGRWRSPIHMPRWASRLTLTVTDVRVERLQDISEEDAMSEGLACLSKDGGRVYKWGIPDRDGLPGTDDLGWPWTMWCIGHRPAFAALWNSLHGDNAWAANPWVAAISFDVHQTNIDALASAEAA